MRIKAVTIRILQQLAHDKRTIGLMILAPIFVLTLMSLIFNGSEYHPQIGIINAPLSFVNKLENKDAKIYRYDEYTSSEKLKNSELDAYIDFKRGKPYITLEGSDPTKSSAVIMLVQNSLQQLPNMVKPDITYHYGFNKMSSFDNFGPILIGFFIFFFVFLIAGVAFLSERNTGTLERLLATPIRRWEIVVGYVLGFGVFTILQSVLISWYTISVLNVMMIGDFILVILITILTAMTGLTIGTFISAYANNELQMIQFIPIVVVPQVFFSGMFDLSTMPSWLAAIGRVMPLYYVADALKNIMIRGRGFESIWIDIVVLVVICLVFIELNIIALKKYRKI